jgi:hypothetical protein
MGKEKLVIAIINNHDNLTAHLPVSTNAFAVFHFFTLFMVKEATLFSLQTVQCISLPATTSTINYISHTLSKFSKAL